MNTYCTYCNTVYVYYKYCFFIGFKNLRSLEDVISIQQIKYDFTYYAIDYETQIPVLTLSTTKSILPVSVVIYINSLRRCTSDLNDLSS